MIARGDVCIVDVPQRGRRLCVIVTRNELQPLLTKVNLVRVTRTIRGLATEVPLDASNGVSKECVANCLDVRTVPKSQIVRRIGQLNPEQLFHLDLALRMALGIDDAA